MLTVLLPPTAEHERRYALDVLVGRWLGLAYRIEIREDGRSEVEFRGERGSLHHPDLFLPMADCDWLGSATLPPAATVRYRDDLPSDWSARIGEPTLPAVFEIREKPLLERKASGTGNLKIRAGIDILGTAFFFLSRYEEAITGASRDEHERFPANESCAGRAGFLTRPVVNEYLEILWLLLEEIEPGARRSMREFRIVPTHDVDKPFQFREMRARKFARFGRAQLRAGRGVGGVLQSGWSWLRTRMGATALDPYFTFPWILDESEAQGLRSVFYVQCTRSSHPQDDNFDHLDRDLVAVMGEAVRRGHEVGVHPGYGTFECAETLGEELGRFRELWDRADCGEQGSPRSRQHFLRWNSAVTPRLLDEAGIAVDSTLGFADRPGFRAGCCYEYPLFDLENRRALGVVEEPLVLMECSVIDDCYLGLGTGEEALELATRVRSKCRRFNGNFVFLWHNHRFVDQKEKDLYRTLLKMDDSKKRAS